MHIAQIFDYYLYILHKCELALLDIPFLKKIIYTYIYICIFNRYARKGGGGGCPSRKKIKLPPNASVAAADKLIEAYLASLEAHPYTDGNGDIIYCKNGEPYMHPEQPPTLAGLARSLGFSSVQALYYRRDHAKHGISIERALLRIREYTESQLFTRTGARGAEFSLRYNYHIGEDDGHNHDKDSNILILAPIRAEGDN